jgi:hypothetical protein
MTIFISQCWNCKHYQRVNKEGKFVCDAFPEGIPDNIFNNKISHLSHYEGDNGIHYEGINKKIDKIFHIYDEFGRKTGRDKKI